MKAKEWREKTVGEREKTLLELRDRLRVLRFDLATRASKQHSEHRKTRRDIARLLTLEREEGMKQD
ncbi:MAG: 50S ribosomal protein L29 [Candidatus Moraniibacteriota bacterium]|jgi:large subunit ribosomal protein L29|nr:MAG: 50S ribosomal protein L29 [Candidatus Moranbacteria bacterium]